MTLSLLVTLMGIGLVDSLNPSLFIAQFYLLTTPKPTSRVVAFLAGILVVMVGGGLLILGGLRTLIGDVISSIPPTSLLVGQLVLGLALVGFGLLYNAPPQAIGDVKKPRSLSLIAAFVLGMTVMVNEITTALPYFIALERITDARLSWEETFVALAVYNTVFVLPMIGFLLAFLRLKNRFVRQSDAITAWVALWTPRLMKYGALLVGAWLLLDAASRLLTG